MSQDRRREDFTDPASTGVRWFRLYEAMDANGGHAQAYKVKWTGTEWSGHLSETKITIYNGPDGAARSADDYVQAVYMLQSRHWEVIEKGSSTENSKFYYTTTASGIGTSEVSIGIGFNSGGITGCTSSGLGLNPSSWAKILRADTAQWIWFSFAGYFHKQTASAGVATCYLYVKRFNAADALQQTETGFCDVPTLSAITAGMTMSFMGRLSMEVNDYVTVTAVFSGGYTSTIAIENASLYMRPILHS